MKPCRECEEPIFEKATKCSKCGAPFPGRETWDGRGYEYKSKASILGLPLLHISFRFGPDHRPVPACGVIAIGQFGIGVVNISQFGVGLVSIGQFTVAGFALAQFALAWDLMAQIGFYFLKGRGQAVISLAELLERLG